MVGMSSSKSSCRAAWEPENRDSTGEFFTWGCCFSIKKKRGQQFFCVLGWVFGRVAEVDMEVDGRWHYLFWVLFIFSPIKQKHIRDQAASRNSGWWVCYWFVAESEKSTTNKLANGQLAALETGADYFSPYHVFQMLIKFLLRDGIKSVEFGGISSKKKD